MKLHKQKDMVKGWLVGHFFPTAFDTEACEVAFKKYKKDDYEDSHYHKVATEITSIIDGTAVMNGIVYNKGDIIVIDPGESTDFKAITNVDTLVVKIPSVKDDKYVK